MAYDYYASGAHDELTLRDNRAAFDRLRLAYRVLVDVAERELATTVLGQPVTMPVLVAPTAFHRLADPEGEVATARAAAAAGTVMVLSTLSNSPVEEVVPAAGGALWFQLYVYQDRGATRALVQRVEAAGCRALVLTVDAPYLGRRERDVRNRFHLPPGLAVANLLADGYGEVPAPLGQSATPAWPPTSPRCSIPPSPGTPRLVALDHPAADRGQGDRPRRRRPARRPPRRGGDRRLQPRRPPARHFDRHPRRPARDRRGARRRRRPGAPGSNVEIYLDGGVRRGTDVVKALALGARAVLVGRPILWGLAAAGEAGVGKALSLLRDELDLAMALCGARTLADLTRDLVVGPH